jgi:hypothetical protein
MGTGTSNTHTQKQVSSKPPRCKLCGQVYTPACDYMQGRCPHHPSMVDQILASPYRTRFYNLIKFFKGKLRNWYEKS